MKDLCEIYTVGDKNRNSLENGDLIAAMQKDNFDFLITSDKNHQSQQNLSKYSIGFIIGNFSACVGVGSMINAWFH